MMKDAQANITYRADYRVSPFNIKEVLLNVQLFEEYALVDAHLSMCRNPASDERDAPLILDGEQLNLESIALDGVTLNDDDYTVTDTQLTVKDVARQFSLHTRVRIYPQKNTALEGLYKSRRMFCTQCEAEGFRKITYYLDRPDVMSIFTTRVEADAQRYPVLLSNGNAVQRETLSGGRHAVTWCDPHKKPSYLFALVAGDLEKVSDQFTTMSGRDVALEIFVEAKDVQKCDHAMASLKAAMRWDEQVYGREYDLDIFMIVAVDDFNMGAMENKGLNIFNSSAILAHPDVTTDAAFQRVEAVVAHEYFHNWSGNRVTCRDWFQLSLKEGFTVYRDSEFSADMNSRGVKRIGDVNLLRSFQFPEDSGPLAHPVRPDSYMEISNFYTVTIYEKGSEVVRMFANLLGPEQFRLACDAYFERFDGQAVTCDDFADVMQDFYPGDLAQFRLWYSQAGTPELHVVGEYKPEKNEYHLQVEQRCPATPGQAVKQPMMIPLKMALVSNAGEQTSTLQATGASQKEHVLVVTQAKQTFVFEHVVQAVVPSLLRGFSAPVKLYMDYSADNLTLLVKYDSDPYARWNAMQSLALRAIDAHINALQQQLEPPEHKEFLALVTYLLANPIKDDALQAEMLSLPNERYLAEQYECVDVHAIFKARNAIMDAMAGLEGWMHIYSARQNQGEYRAESGQIARRRLKNLALAYLMRQAGPDAPKLAQQQYLQANNMTDRVSALNTVVHALRDDISALKQQLLDDFYQRYQHESLVVNMWLQIQAANPAEDTLDTVKALLQHDAFDENNPNKLRALIGVFSGSNAICFHRTDGQGYALLVEQIRRLNKSNPQMAARMLTPLIGWRRFPDAASQRMRKHLQDLAKEELSKDVREVVEKSLAE